MFFGLVVFCLSLERLASGVNSHLTIIIMNHTHPINSNPRSRSLGNFSNALSFTIFLNSPNGKHRLDEHDRVSVIHKITQKFNSFTLVDGKGFRDGQYEDTLLIHIKTTQSNDVVELAHALRNTFNLEEIAIQFGYHTLHVHPDNMVKVDQNGIEDKNGQFETDKTVLAIEKLTSKLASI